MDLDELEISEKSRDWRTAYFVHYEGWCASGRTIDIALKDLRGRLERCDKNGSE